MEEHIFVVGTAWDALSLCKIGNLIFGPKVKYFTSLCVLLAFKSLEESKAFLLNKESLWCVVPYELCMICLQVLSFKFIEMIVIEY